MGVVRDHPAEISLAESSDVARDHPRKQSIAEENGVLRDSPSAPFDPRNLGKDLLCWARADLGITPNSSAAAAWADFSGEGNNWRQTTADDQPTISETTFGARAELRFDGSNDSMLGLDLYGELSSASYWTIVVVMQGWSYGISSNPWTAEGILGAPSGGANYFNVGSVTKAAGSVAFQNYDGSANQGALSGATGLDEGVPIIAVFATDNGTGFVRANGQQGTSNANTSSLNSNATTVKLGKGPRSDVQTPDFYGGSFSEVMIFDGALSSADISSLESALALRYGIAL